MVAAGSTRKPTRRASMWCWTPPTQAWPDLVKIRHYGLLANRHRADKLKLSRRLLLPVRVAAAHAGAEPSAASGSSKIEPAPVPHCPKCGGCRFLRIELAKETDAAN